MEKKTNKKVIKRKVSNTKKKKGNKGKKNNLFKLTLNIKKMNFIKIVDYTFFVSLALTIIFGIQTNTTIFFVPFVVVLLITLVCMGIILVNAIYSKIKKIMKKNKKEF